MNSLKSSFRHFSNIVNGYTVGNGIKRFARTAFSDKYLLYTNITISITLSSFGDFLEQNYEMYKKEIDSWNKSRTMHMGCSGMTVGFICHNWYKFLDKKIPGRTLSVVVKKMLADQLICSPVIITTFFATVCLFENATIEEFKTEIKQKFLRLYKAEWIVWPPAQIINFYLLPTKYRVLYDNTISLGYDVFTSHVKHSKGEHNDSDSKNEVKTDKLQDKMRISELDSKNACIKKSIVTLIS